MITLPPLFSGGVHERSIVVVPLAVAVRLVGAPGTVVGGRMASSVVALSVLEAAPVPLALMAETR